jgi:HSP20 family protein
MKILFNKIILATLISTSLFANNLSLNHTNQNDDLAQMQSFFNNMVNQMMSNNIINDSFSSLNLSYPKLDMTNTKDKYILKFELAGMDKNDINLSINDDKILTIQGEKKYKKEDKSDKFVKQESYYGKFKRVVTLPKDANINKIKSKFKNGILEVTIDKLKSKKTFSKSLKIN